jgi:hypothetical protein
MYLKLFTRCNLIDLHTSLDVHVSRLHMWIKHVSTESCFILSVRNMLYHCDMFVAFAPFKHASTRMYTLTMRYNSAWCLALLPSWTLRAWPALNVQHMSFCTTCKYSSVKFHPLCCKSNGTQSNSTRLAQPTRTICIINHATCNTFPMKSIARTSYTVKGCELVVALVVWSCML